MTDLHKAATMALEALELASSCVDAYYIPKGKMYLPDVEAAITALREALAAPVVPEWIAVSEKMPPPDVWLLVAWGKHGAVDTAHTFAKWKHPTHPLGYLIQGHPGAHNDVTHWMPRPAAPQPKDKP